MGVGVTRDLKSGRMEFLEETRSRILVGNAVVRFFQIASWLAILIPTIGPATAGALTAAFETAVERDAAVQTLVARRAQIAAALDATEYLIPAPPLISLGHLTDLPTRNSGFREYEVELSVPLWLPREQGATRSLVETQASGLEAAIVVARLRVAGAVRDVYWNVEAARRALALAVRKRDTAAALVDDTARQTRAGQVARLDLHLAEAALQEAEAIVAESDAELGVALISFRALTGMEPPASFVELEPSDTFPTDHPQIHAIKWEAERATAELRLALIAVREAPEVAFVARSERDDFDGRFITSLGVRVEIPFSSEARNKPRRAAAVAAHSAALAELSASEREIQASVERARVALGSARRQVTALDQRIAALQSALVLTEQAYRFGEAPFVEVIRARGAVFEAEAARLNARIAAERARSDVNQALGIQP